ncbi:MAG TPA: hypothetical protein VFC84_19480 [Desulfosporosinus sp.]|nr:hypothetical protein [Desulfosporosinus sp.]
MEEIRNHNAGVTMCSEKTCDKKPTMFDIIDYYGLIVHVTLCDKHYQQVFDKYNAHLLECFDKGCTHSSTPRMPE